jgi:hypothetical protein
VTRNLRQGEGGCKSQPLPFDEDSDVHVHGHLKGIFIMMHISETAVLSGRESVVGRSVGRAVSAAAQRRTRDL